MVMLVIYTFKIKRKKLNPKKYLLTSSAPTYLWPVLTMYLYLKASEVWQIGSSPFSIYTIKWKGKLHTIGMAIHHYKPSIALARAIGAIWIYKHRREKQTKIRVNKKRNFNLIQITMKKKTYLHRCHPQYKLYSPSSMKLSSLSYINKTRIHKRKEKT